LKYFFIYRYAIDFQQYKSFVLLFDYIILYSCFAKDGWIFQNVHHFWLFMLKLKANS